MPIRLWDAEEFRVVLDENGNVFTSSRPKVAGHSLTVAQNTYNDVGWSLPNNEEQAQTAPVWWINNCVINYGWTGNNTDDDVIGPRPQANRYGVQLDPKQPIAIHFLYNNVISSTVNSPSYNNYHGWSSYGQLNWHPGTRFYNNVWTSHDANRSGNVAENKSVIWKAEITRLINDGPSGQVNENHLLSKTSWDYNQYWLSGVGDENTGNRAFGDGYTFEQITGIPYNFETNGSYSNPGAISEDCTVESPIEHKHIAGVTGNQYLGLGE